MPDHDPTAEHAANDWLQLIDRGNAQLSWRTAATLFRSAVNEPQWTEALAAVRGPLGAVVRRTLKDARSAAELPGAPDGDYVVFQFETEFERKRAAIETVTPMKDVDGQWRVSGYFVR